MRALLINPPFPETFWSFRHALRFVRKRAAFPPLGLLTVAAMLPKQWELRVVDMQVRPLRERDLRWADSAWITGMTVQSDAARAVIDRCRAAGVKTVAGGPLFTCEPERFADVDHLVLNEAEVTLRPFLDDLETDSARRVYTSEDKPDLRLTPVPRWDLVKVRHYASMSVQYSRGCPFDCDFCNVTALLGRKPRTKTPDQIIAELDACRARGWRGPVFFVDDNLIGHKKALLALLDAMQVWQTGKPRIEFYTQVSINLADNEQLTRRMVDAGFDTVFVGIETPDEHALAECSKRQNLRRDLVADVRKLHRAGLQVQAGFILGFDSDTPSIFRRQIEFIQHSGIVTAMVGLLQAPVGTRLYQRLSLEGRLLGQSSGNNVTASTNVKTMMPINALRDGFQHVIDSIYAPEAYYRRIKTFLNDYRPGCANPPLSWGRLLAFARSIVYLGVFDRARWQYWKLVIWTLLRRRRLLPLSISLWIAGHHFRTICRLASTEPTPA